MSETTTPAAAPGAPARRPGGQPILSIRASVPADEADHFVAAALHDIRAYLQEHHVTPAGPPFSVCWSREDELDVEAGWPTPEPLPGTSRIHAGTLPHSVAVPHKDTSELA